ncbi:NACHT domain-containing protein [Kamptonema sp. UHCC 0994]|uniref:NACHT domain-containing protein n=1 Tax=Kamptonema sp. UHCC 0994 TaxID=3031329 RepID=UPI0023B9441D|nr:NACHT domain-containing protein [Kamptonema sp. UHCC 0994]MDF0555503.1 NACHT domain-containing protein [Kamptonema sp. UHCC 0994]
MDVARSLVKLAVGTGCVLCGLACSPILAEAGIVWGPILASFLGNVAAGNTANAIDALTAGEDPDTVSLENKDLTKAVGKAIAAVITLAAKQHRGKTHDNLEKIAIQAKNNWVKIAQQELTQQRYPQLREAKLDQFLTPEEYSLTQDGNLTAPEWQDIFIRLNMAACKGGGFQLPPEVYPQVAKLLHTTFPKALRETLKEDFAKDGKAFAGLTLQLLTGMKAELAQLRNTNLGVNAAELTQILQEFQQLETQLRGTVAQQQAFFRQISQDIDSGFAEVCQQLGVMETNITALLQNLEKRLDALDEKLTRLEAQGGGRQLSKQEFRNRQALLSQMRAELAGRKPLHHAVPLNLGKEQQPHQVQRLWDDSVKVGEQRSFLLPSQTSILEVFKNPAISGKFLILGKPGGGKTTTLLELAQALVERAETDSDAPIPVILELSEWRTITKGRFRKKEEYDPSIKEWILSQLRSKGISQEIGEQWIREKELVLLLDGLDELPSELQAKCVRAINEFLKSEFSPLHLVVCSRKEEYENYQEVLHLNGAICLEDLSVEQMRHYFASVNLAEFWDRIKDSEKIVNFISQPLFLAITSIAYQQIDVEEWRNCNTEKNSIDYLLGIYRVEMLTKKRKSKFYKTKREPKSLLAQNNLIRLARYSSKEFQSDLLGGDLLTNSRDRLSYIGVTLLFMILICSIMASNAIALIQNQINIENQLVIANYLYFGFTSISTIPMIVVIISMFVAFMTLMEEAREFLEKVHEKVHNINSVKNKILDKMISFTVTIITIVNVILLFGLSFFAFKILSDDTIFLYILNIGLNSHLAKSIILGCGIALFFLPFTLCFKPATTMKIIGFNPLGALITCGVEIVILLFIVITLIFDWRLLHIVLHGINIETVASAISFVVSSVIAGGVIGSLIIEIENGKRQESNTIVIYFINTLVLFLLGMLSGIIPTLNFSPVNVALSNGIILGLIFSLFAISACIQYLALRLTLWLTGQMPWNITRFLNYCTERLILQRVGNRYRFIHRLVQEHFANLEIQKE